MTACAWVALIISTGQKAILCRLLIVHTVAWTHHPQAIPFSKLRIQSAYVCLTKGLHKAALPHDSPAMPTSQMPDLCVPHTSSLLIRACVVTLEWSRRTQPSQSQADYSMTNKSQASLSLQQHVLTQTSPLCSEAVVAVQVHEAIHNQSYRCKRNDPYAQGQCCCHMCPSTHLAAPGGIAAAPYLSDHRLRVAMTQVHIFSAQHLFPDHRSRVAMTQVHIYTAHHDPRHCFEETVGGAFSVFTAGAWFPRHLWHRCYALCTYIRCLLAAMWLAWTSWRCLVN